MKKITILLLSTVMFACNNQKNEETKNNSLLWAENVEALVPMVQDSAWTKENWDEVYKYDKPLIFSSITNAVLTGKLKAYSSYPDGELSVNDFKDILAKWDSTHMTQDPNNPGTMFVSPLLIKTTPADIVQIRFNEKIELDTVNYTINKKVSFVTFVGPHIDNATGEVDGLKKLFDVKLNTAPKEQK